MNNKKSFILYTDMLDCLDGMNDEDVADLFRMIKAYHNQEDYEPRPVAGALFHLFKNQFERDEAKYQSVCERNKANANKRWQKDATACDRIPNDTKDMPSGTKNADTDNDTDTGNDKEILLGRGFDRFWEVYPKKVKKKEVVKKWKARKLERIADQLVADVENRIANDDKWKRGYIPDPTTYINGDLWEDEIQRTMEEPGEVKQWFDHWPGIVEKGESMGLYERDYDTAPSYKNAVISLAKNRGLMQ